MVAFDQAKELFDKREYLASLEFMAAVHVHERDSTVRRALKLNMAKCFYQLRRPDLAEGLIRNLDYGSDDPMVQIDLSLYLNWQGKHDESFQILQSLQQDIPAVKFNLGWHLVRQGKFLEGFDLMNTGREINVFGSIHRDARVDPRKIRAPNKRDRTAVYMEGGHGDCLIFARWLPLLERESGSLVVYCPKSMVDLIRGMGHLASPEKNFDPNQFDCVIPAMAIPSLLRLNDPFEGVDRPDYIQVNVEDPTLKFMPGFKIGVTWAGNPEFEHEQFRKVPVENFESLASIGDLYDFQIESHAVRGSTWIGNRINSWLDTYCIMREMDLVVSSCTSVAHLAAGMGKGLAVLTPLVPYFVWEGKPWYGSNVLELRQKTDGSWGDVSEEIRSRMDSGTCQVP
jgi:hypothetical protein